MESLPHHVVMAQNLVGTVAPLAQDIVRRLVVLREQCLQIAIKDDLFKCITRQAQPALILDGLTAIDLGLVRNSVPRVKEEVNFPWPP